MGYANYIWLNQCMNETVFHAICVGLLFTVAHTIFKNELIVSTYIYLSLIHSDKGQSETPVFYFSQKSKT